jgi:hypothetical protein
MRNDSRQSTSGSRRRRRLLLRLRMLMSRWRQLDAKDKSAEACLLSFTERPRGGMPRLSCQLAVRLPSQSTTPPPGKESRVDERREENTGASLDTRASRAKSQTRTLWTHLLLRVLLRVELDHVVDPQNRDSRLGREAQTLDLANGGLHHTGREVVAHLALEQVEA